MEKQELKSKWDELARELGAEISPEIAEREESRVVSSTEAVLPAPSPETSRAATSSPPPPKRPPADWAKLVDDLGLPPLEPEPAAAEAAPLEQRRPAAHPEETPRRQPVDKPPREPRQRQEQRGQRERRPDSRGNRRRPSSQDREQRRPRRDEAEDFERQPVPEARHEFEPPSREPDEQPKPPAVSLWHKIFGAPTEQSTNLVEEPAAAGPRTEIDERSDEPREVFGDSIRSLSGADVMDAAIVEDLDRGEDSSLTTEELPSSERMRGRPRRRRRGGRGRRSERQGESRRPAAHDAESKRDSLDISNDFDDLQVSDTVDDALDDKFDADEDAGEDHLDEVDSDRSKAAQRTIPSWEEAIGFIVDSNMQTRSQRKATSRGGSPSRARSRGRRKS